MQFVGVLWRQKLRRAVTSRRDCGCNGNSSAAIARSLSAQRLFFLGDRGLCGNIGSLGQRSGIVVTENHAAQANRRVDLGLPEQAVGITSVAQGIKQNVGAGLEILRQFRMSPQGDLAERKFAGISAAGIDEFDPCLDFIDIGGIDRGSRCDILGRWRTQEPPDAAGCGVDLGLEEIGYVAADRRKLATPD